MDLYSRQWLAGTPIPTWTVTQVMNGPAGADIKWKGIAARPFKVVVLVELAARARKEGCAQSDAARVPVAVWQAALRACQCTANIAAWP